MRRSNMIWRLFSAVMAPFSLRNEIPHTPEIMEKQKNFEFMDMCYKHDEIREKIDTDKTVHDLWVTWTYSSPFVWRFLFAKEEEGFLTKDGLWLREAFKEAIGEKAYNYKLQQTKLIVESAGDTIESCV